MSEMQAVTDVVPDTTKNEAETTIPVPTVKLQVFQQAVPFQFYAEVPKAIMEAKFDQIWAEREPTIPPQVLEKARKGFRATTPASELRKRIVTIMGGEDQFYEPAMLQIIDAAFRDFDPKPKVEIFSWLNVDKRDLPNGDFVLLATAFFEPEVIWNVPARPRGFKVIFPKESPTYVEDTLNRHLTMLASKHNVTEINDDLAITCGFQSLAQLSGTVQKQIEDKMVSDKETQAFEAIRDYLFSQMKISPIPESWRQYKAQEAYQESVRRFKNEETFLKAVGGRSREDIIRNYSQQMAASLAEQLAFRAWADGMVEGDSGLHNIFAYFNTVKKHVLNTMEIAESEDAIGPIKVEGIWENTANASESK